MTVEHRPPSTPKGLGVAGKRMWRAIARAYLLRPDELFQLESACRVADIVVSLESAMVGRPLTVLGSMGQEREHPLLSEARQQRALLSRLLAGLRLPDEQAEAGASDQSIRARNAAMARWHRGAS